MLPTFLGASRLSAAQLWTTIIGFTVLYGALAVVEVGLILKTIKQGPFAEQESAEPARATASAATACPPDPTGRLKEPDHGTSSRLSRPCA